MHFSNILPNNLFTNLLNSQNYMSAKKKKVCSICKQEERTFHKNHTKKDGLHEQCTDCRRAHEQLNWAVKIVRDSRKHDKDMHRPIGDVDYIDKQWIQELMRNNPNCHYCNVPLFYGRGINRSTHPYGLQLDRMDSHLKSNCVQCCRTCNGRGTNKPYVQNIEIVIKMFL